jgi:hypothetical protein
MISLFVELSRKLQDVDGRLFNFSQQLSSKNFFAPINRLFGVLHASNAGKNASRPLCEMIIKVPSVTEFLR